MDKLTWLMTLIGVVWSLPVGSAWAEEGRIQINQAVALAGLDGGDTAGFPVTLSTAGTYVLTGDLDLSAENSNNSGIVITAEGTTLDLNGHSITGPVTCTGGSSGTCNMSGNGSGIDATHRSVVLNGRVRGFARNGLVTGQFARVEDVIASSNRLEGIKLADYSVAANLTAVDNGGSGIGAGQAGIQIGGGCVLTNSVSAENVGNGITTGSAATVIGNVSLGNGGVGIQTSGGGVAVSENVTTENDVGVLARSGDIVSSNVIGSNTTTGISAVGSPGYEHNVLDSNGTAVSFGTPLNLGENACNGSLCP